MPEMGAYETNDIIPRLGLLEKLDPQRVHVKLRAAPRTSYIKLTDQSGRSFGQIPHPTEWGPGIRHETATNESGIHIGKLRPGFPGGIHFYRGLTPLLTAQLALLLNPAHRGIESPKLWIFQPEGDIVEDRYRCVCRAGTTLEEYPLTDLPADAFASHTRIHVGIRLYYHLKLPMSPEWRVWSTYWLHNRRGPHETAGLTDCETPTGLLAKAGLLLSQDEAATYYGDIAASDHTIHRWIDCYVARAVVSMLARAQPQVLSEMGPSPLEKLFVIARECERRFEKRARLKMRRDEIPRAEERVSQMYRVQQRF